MFPAHPSASSLCSALTLGGAVSSSTCLRGPTAFRLMEQRGTQSSNALLTLHLYHIHPHSPNCSQHLHTGYTGWPSSQTFLQNKDNTCEALLTAQGPPGIGLRLRFCRNHPLWGRLFFPALCSHCLAGLPSVDPKNLAQGLLCGNLTRVSGYHGHHDRYQERFFTSDYYRSVLTELGTMTLHKCLEATHGTCAVRELRKHAHTEILGLQSFAFSLIPPKLATGYLKFGVMWVSHKASQEWCDTQSNERVP